MNYKQELKRILNLVDGDIKEQIMEMNPNYHFRNKYLELNNCTQLECKGILETLQEYKSEGLDLQGEPITFDINIPYKIKYFIRSMAEWDSMADVPGLKQGYTMGYHKSQPEYKSWVPNWVIRLITI